MTMPIQDKARLTELLERVILKLVGDAGEQLDKSTGGKAAFGKLKGLANMKADLAKKAVEFSMKRLGGNADEKFNRIVDLSNTHLDQFVGVVGEDRIVARLKAMDEVVDAEAVSILEQAGASKLATLFRKALPVTETAPVAKAFVAAGAAAVATAGGVAALKAAGKSEAVAPAAVEATDAAAEEDSEVEAVEHDAQPEAPVTLGMLHTQLEMLTSMRDFAAAAIAKTEDAIAAMEQHAEPEQAPPPKAEPEIQRNRPEKHRPKPAAHSAQSGPWQGR